MEDEGTLNMQDADKLVIEMRLLEPHFFMPIFIVTSKFAVAAIHYH